jgi:hypothetical protein
MPDRTATPALLHLFLGIGLMILAVLFTVLNYAGVGPLLKADPDATKVMAYVFAGLSMAMTMVAFVVLRPRVPSLASGQTVEQFWKTPSSVAPVMLVWFVSEGAGVFACVGYLLTGSVVVALAMLIAIAAFWMSGPQAIVKG